MIIYKMDEQQFKTDDKLMLLHRTDGDGMEKEPINNPNDSSTATPINKYNHNNKRLKHIQHYIKHFKQIEMHKLHLIYLKPKLIVNQKKNTKNQNEFHDLSNCYKSNREARFLAKEPFKGAVTQMTTITQNNNKYHLFNKKYKICKNNNVDIQVLVSQMSNLAKKELKNNNDKDLIETTTTTTTDNNNKQLYDEIKKLKDTNEQLEKQLRFQTQVNSELKTLLVAAVGEDLEARVQLLTQDKLQLARALLSSAQNLSSHREQVEYLAGHSEVWRSKFLASSLMVDELAKYKNVLSDNLDELQQCIKHLLDEHQQFNLITLNVFHLLLNIVKQFNININVNIEQQMNVIDLIQSCVQLSETITLHLFNKTTTTITTSNNNNNNNNIKISNTYAESIAQQALTKINLIDTTTSNHTNTNTMIYQLLLNQQQSKQQQQQQQEQQQHCCVHCNNSNINNSNILKQ